MEEFLIKYYSILTHGVEIMAAVTGLLLFKKYKPTAVRYFIYFLVYVVFVELIGSYPRYLDKLELLDSLKELINNSRFKENYWWYTIFWSIGSILFYSFYYQKILTNKSYKRIIKYSGFIFLIISIVTIISDLDKFFNTTCSIIIRGSGLIVILLCVLFYLIEMLNSDRILNFYRSFNFYVSATILIWWLVTIPLTFYGIYNIEEDMDFVMIKWKVFLFSNIFMYSIFTFALIWCRPQKE